ncbi:prepilin-type N-terminal cleavage/methylation domain-containing protein [Lentibacillus juripiscarius]|uniref:Prepilin-type N-terminal cleavage/methylation domain-containing protein n=1 Tax=Lentibacillus juripiscarius TaxID=257446 RepID=A0ABW5V169_9BACI
MTNNKGFTLIETIVAASLLLMVVATLIPAANLLMNERMVLEQKHHIVKELHRELQSYLWDNKHPLLPNDYMKKINGAEATFSFTTEEELMKGCVTWTNARKRESKFCLYGYPDK